jgi:23S rRNA maturation mini-RNase III
MYGEALNELAASDEADAARKRLNETIANNPIAPEMLNGIISGKNEDGSDFNLDEYLLDQHMDYLLDYLEDNATAKEKMQARKQEREAARKADEDFAATVAAKTAAEDAELDAAIAEAGYKAEQVKDLIDWIYDKENGFITRAKNFDLKKDDFLRLFHIKDWDLKMKEADEAGYKRGKNEKIDMFKRKQQQRREMPADVGGGGGTGTGAGERQTDPYLERLERMKNM